MDAGQAVVAVVDNLPGSVPAGAVYACPDGRLTWPSRLFVRNACAFPGVNCAATAGAGAACDAGPASDPLWGDRDGCPSGHLLPGADGTTLWCAADWPTPAMSVAPAQWLVRVGLVP